MSRLPADVQLLALALLNYADDEGYFLAEASLIRSACQPFRDESGNTTGIVRTLIQVQWIQVTWSDAHGPIGRVTNFKSHQVVNKPKPSKLKQYWGAEYDYGNPPVRVPESSGTRTGGNGMDQGKERKGMEPAESAAGDLPGIEDMGKKKNTVQESLIQPAFMASPEFMEAWTGFLEMRNEIKKPATEYAQKLLLRKLETMSEGKIGTAVAILEQSVLSSWQDVYPLKTNGGGNGGGFQRNGAAPSQARPDMDYIPTGEG